MNTPSQTGGPFLSIGTEWLVEPDRPGSPLLTGQVFDGAGAPVTDALLEFWQADSSGRFPPSTEPGWTGFGRALTDPTGAYRYYAEKPGPVAGHAPVIVLSIFARGLMQRLVTRIYFYDEAERNAADPLWSTLPAGRRDRMIALKSDAGYRFDIHLQGAEEAVFFAPWPS